MSIKVHPLYIVFSFVLIYCGRWQSCLVYLIVLILHEMAHYLVARILGYKLTNVVFMPYGIGIGGNNVFFAKRHEIWIALAGPLCNFLLALITMSGWWLVPVSYHYTGLFFEVNIVLGVFNLIPLYPLDGGRVLYACCHPKYMLRVERTEKWFCMITAVLFLGCFVYSVMHTVNFSLLFIALFLLASIGRYQKDFFHSKLLTSVERSPKVIETVMVYHDTKVADMIKMLRCDKYYHFVVVDKNNKPIKTITQDQLIALSKAK